MALPYRRRVGLVAAIVLVLLVAGVVILIKVPNPLTRAFADNACTVDATRQLPAETVNKVNDERVRHNVPDKPKTILQRKASKHYQAIAFVYFDKYYCGFVGNINDVPISDEAKHGQDGGPDPNLLLDVVHVIKHGIEDNTYDGMRCISDTVPTAWMTDGHIEMQLVCDRSYTYA